LIGGNDIDTARAVVVNPDTRIAWVAGDTQSTNFPNQSPPGQSLPPFQGNQPGVDPWVAKFDWQAGGNASLIWATDRGGAGSDVATAIAVDATQRVYVAGFTGSANFPATDINGPVWDGQISGANDAFLTKLNADGTRVFYSGFIGGSGSERAF